MQNEQVEILVGPISASSGNFGNTSPDLDISVAVGDPWQQTPSDAALGKESMPA